MRAQHTWPAFHNAVLSLLPLRLLAASFAWPAFHNAVLSLLPFAFACSIIRLEKELKALGGDVKFGRGSMLHMILTLCHELEKAYTKTVDGGRDGACPCVCVCVYVCVWLCCT